MPMITFDNIFVEIAALLLAAAAVGALSMCLRQPLILGYIFVGILAGPSMLGWVIARDQIDLLARLGIAMLLFVVGLKLVLHLIRPLGPVALATGLEQVIFTSVIGYFMALPLGLSPVAAIYVAVALTFSSAIIIVKLLSDKREIDTLHHYGYSGKKAVTAHSSSDAEILRESGADLILSPFADAAKEAADLMIRVGSSENQ
jgi:Kef-type K+ transport system membrane component KefB